eukprot:6071533-Pleurochrysis_carterae.AAC.1
MGAARKGAARGGDGAIGMGGGACGARGAACEGEGAPGGRASRRYSARRAHTTAPARGATALDGRCARAVRALRGLRGRGTQRRGLAGISADIQAYQQGDREADTQVGAR